MNNSDSNTEINNSFGLVLAEARKAQNYSVDDICEHIKIPKHVISAIEANDVEALPPPTFTQGYIRTYAKFLEISDKDLLEMYHQAIPHDSSSTLKPRSSLPGEASSQSPVVKAVTMLLIVGSIAAVLYGSFQYYQEKADVMENELESKQRSFTGNSLDSPGSGHLDGRQSAGLAEDAESLAASSDSFESQIAEEAVLPPEITEASEGAVVGVVAEESEPVMQDDVVEIYAEQGAWMEVKDATLTRLLYNMVPSGESKVLKGKAPFRISMGNARSTRVVINDIEIDFTAYISSKNTASFTVSNEGENILFY